MGRTLSELVAVLLSIGMIVGAFEATGLTGPLANELVHVAGNSMPMLLIMGVITRCIVGMRITVTACYIFLAVVLAPALVQAGLNELAVHLFIWYWGMVSFVGPLNSGALTALMRLFLFVAGLMIAAPIGGILGLSHAALTFLGFAIALPPLFIAWRAGQVPEIAYG